MRIGKEGYIEEKVQKEKDDSGNVEENENEKGEYCSI